ncbi:NmrA family NAD(P)-binding protein [Tardiphaga sp. P9-11]|uniref:NmrA family NAD(P)-binding protein n=1 Tax=Tardiphaga sp. P9-11 TaxID=2024614 RepID=UPI0011F20FF1|nr:NmrA family NAD(P)-binding protein [Tardiphaga sp. P9-11]KAA0069975.1 NAD-dependent epimerase/dehydratase family protein [Tardiphaga sp. P9-11]
MKPILVSGATGTVGGTGRHLVKLLLDRGAAVRAMVRKEDARSQALRDAGAEVVSADFLDEEAVRRAMEGISTAYFCPPVFDVLLHATTVFALCARDCAVSRIINLSQWGTIDPILSPATRLHRFGEAILDWSGVPTSHLRPAMFMEQLVVIFGDSVRQKGMLVAPFNQEKASMVAASDVSRVAAAIALQPEHFGPGGYQLTGAENYSLEDVAVVMTDVIGRKVTYQNVDPNVWEKMASNMGIPAHVVAHLGKLYEKGRLGKLNYTPTSEVERVGGASPTTLKDFVQVNRAAFA